MIKQWLDLVHQILYSCVVITTIFIYFMNIVSMHTFFTGPVWPSFSRSTFKFISWSLTGSTHSFKIILLITLIANSSKSQAILFAFFVVPTTKITFIFMAESIFSKSIHANSTRCDNTEQFSLLQFWLYFHTVHGHCCLFQRTHQVNGPEFPYWKGQK